MFIKMSDEKVWKEDGEPASYIALTNKVEKMQKENKRLGDRLKSFKTKPPPESTPSDTQLTKHTRGTHSFVSNGFPKTCPIVNKEAYGGKNRAWMWDNVAKHVIGPDGKGYTWCSKRHGSGCYMPYPHDCDAWLAKKKQAKLEHEERKERRSKFDRDSSQSGKSGEQNGSQAKKRKLVAREKVVSSLTTHTNLDPEQLEKVADLTLEAADSLKD